MMVEDRVVTTAFLLELNQIPECDELQLGHSVLDGLEADAFHVLVPVGHTHGLTDPKVVCRAQLAVGNDGPLLKEVLISREMYESLPTAFSVLNAVGGLVPIAVGEVDGELEALFALGDALVAGQEGDEDVAGIDTFGEGNSDGSSVDHP